ncbi:hypothetical protein SAMN05421510_10362 [Nitrosomonas ureae]|uniref:Uncharacterized protein n=1 Tax=Nitrosomonas ureae TaxID=44577 RepID=A0A1H9EX37_9PROT|nr:hypothetical protein SAMN05421510_10362 [Nitrosomonas ureae]
MFDSYALQTLSSVNRCRQFVMIESVDSFHIQNNIDLSSSILDLQFKTTRTAGSPTSDKSIASFSQKMECSIC